MSPQRTTPQPERKPGEDWRRFLDRTVHDLSAPLRAIGTSAELLSETHGDALNDEARQLVENVIEGAARIDRLLRGLADFSMALELEGYAVGAIPVEGVVRSALASVDATMKETGASVDYSFLPEVTGNWEQLTLLFSNLLRNALDHRGEAAEPRISISADRDGTAWKFAVKDNGPGIDPQYWHRIFLPFERLQSGRKSSAGLGLAICKKIVESHGGRIWVESKPGLGSTFFFTLPDAAH